jgi:hypothetical protein
MVWCGAARMRWLQEWCAASLRTGMVRMTAETRLLKTGTLRCFCGLCHVLRQALFLLGCDDLRRGPIDAALAFFSLSLVRVLITNGCSCTPRPGKQSADGNNALEMPQSRYRKHVPPPLRNSISLSPRTV